MCRYNVIRLVKTFGFLRIVLVLGRGETSLLGKPGLGLRGRTPLSMLWAPSRVWVTQKVVLKVQLAPKPRVKELTVVDFIDCIVLLFYCD